MITVSSIAESMLTLSSSPSSSFSEESEESGGGRRNTTGSWKGSSFRAGMILGAGATEENFLARWVGWMKVKGLR